MAGPLIREPGAPGDRSDDSLRVRIQDARLFPAARPKRVLGVKTAIDPTLEALMDTTGALPRPRVFPWRISETANSRRSWSTPILQGPIFINGISWWATTAADPPTESLEIGYALTPVQEAGVALATIRPYTVLTELLDPFNTVAAATGDGILHATIPAGTPFNRYPLGLIITERQAVVVIAVVNNSISAQQWVGYLTVTEQVSRKALESYIGSP